jgi:hypothetical protein
MYLNFVAIAGVIKNQYEVVCYQEQLQKHFSNEDQLAWS